MFIRKWHGLEGINIVVAGHIKSDQRSPPSRCALWRAASAANHTSPIFRISKAGLPAVANRQVRGGWRRGSESNRRMRLLQSPALPLGYPAARNQTITNFAPRARFVFRSAAFRSIKTHFAACAASGKHRHHPALTEGDCLPCRSLARRQVSRLRDRRSRSLAFSIIHFQSSTLVGCAVNRAVIFVN